MIRPLSILVCAVALSAASSVSPALSQNDPSLDPAATVHMKGSVFDPQSTYVKVGQTVVFDNDDQVTHNVTDTDKGISSGDVGAGKTWQYTFKRAGDYHYVCTYHPWMKGEITVSKGK